MERTLYPISDNPRADAAMIIRGSRIVAGDEVQRIAHEEGNVIPREEGQIQPSTRLGYEESQQIHGRSCWPANHDTEGICEQPVCMDDAGRVDLKHDPYCLRIHFTTRWAVVKDSETGGSPQGGAVVTWSDRDMFLETEGENVNLRAWNRSYHGVKPSLTKIYLWDLISAPLLLYRILANFRASPDMQYAEKTQFSYTFWHREDPTCRLEINDYKGWAQMEFFGSEKSSNEALQLVEWLTGTNCPIDYDYVLAGAHA
ncbi:hypothetical protein F5Y18DRAFT_438678 [Xylariaceae sp. FL1019]|nr:hypothetical protein F5Y18DRAFT_438678 [Xylariaceae sp. FL1019]